MFRVRAAIHGLYRGLEAVIVRPGAGQVLYPAAVVQPQPLQEAVAVQPQVQVHPHLQFNNDVNTPVRLHAQAQAPQNQFQQQLRAAYLRRQDADLALDGHQVRAHVDMRNAERQDQQHAHVQHIRQQLNRLEQGMRCAGRHDQNVPVQDVQQQLDHPERRLRQRPSVPMLPVLPAFGANERPANGRDANARAGLRGGLAFGGLDANRALRNHGNWPAEQQRNLPRQ